MQIQEANFQSILFLWQNELWPGRSDIEEYSWMKFGGGHYEKFDSPKKKFWTALDQAKQIGVISTHALPEQKCVRMRGLWIHPDYRRKNIGSSLISIACEWANHQDAQIIWTYPRQEAWPVYAKQGFKVQSDWIKDEKGIKHCYASKSF